PGTPSRLVTERRKLLVTGAQGFVAGSVLAQAGPEWQVHALSRRQPETKITRVSWHTCDVLNPDHLAGLLRQVHADALIHTAAIADIDLAERDKDLAHVVNVEMTRSLVNACA